MVDPSGRNTPNVDGEELPVEPPVSLEYAQVKLLLQSLSTEKLQRLRVDVQSEIDHRIRERIHQREEEERARQREEERIEDLYAAWRPKYFARRERKDEECAEKHAKALKYGSATESDSEASDGFEYEMEEVDTSDLDSDAAADKEMMEKYHERKVRSRFEYELSNPKIFARTMNEGEPEKGEPGRWDAEMQEAKSDEEDIEEEDEGSEESSSYSGTSPAPSDSDESERYEEEGWDTDEEDFGSLFKVIWRS